MIAATLQLYKDALVDTGRSLARGVWGFASLFIASVVVAVVSVLVAPFGLAGGFALGFLVAGLAGWYLALVEISVTGRRRIHFSDLRDEIGTYLWSVISVMFIFWIASMVLELMGNPVLVLVISVGAGLVFNPVPEIVYQDRLQSVDALQRGVQFMQQNWPEWIVPHLVIFGGLTGWGYWANGVWSISWIVELIMIFGPFFQFILAGTYALQFLGNSTLGFISFVGMFLLVHAVMVFRGHLYRRLRGSSRRGRAWQARMQ